MCTAQQSGDIDDDCCGSHIVLTKDLKDAAPFWFKDLNDDQYFICSSDHRYVAVGLSGDIVLTEEEKTATIWKFKSLNLHGQELS